ALLLVRSVGGASRVSASTGSSLAALGTTPAIIHALLLVRGGGVASRLRPAPPSPFSARLPRSPTRSCSLVAAAPGLGVRADSCSIVASIDVGASFLARRSDQRSSSNGRGAAVAVRPAALQEGHALRQAVRRRDADRRTRASAPTLSLRPRDLSSGRRCE